ncbi:hypothetical protein [Vibrio harveyi]|uniref:hypothetical protein n=1 Tax=Vibrio harveyi TaxID=669 RepID=UPI001EFE0DED|nr:hypothetical protein [Vibrio harveyi]MCG9589960.1 hypothetical protein [Vibrio harveyi]MCG9670259.1 hypothetical protein [Vibrio harveyi]WJT11011.1 hypothetical protein PH545_28860 [Vibrio harveyi]
MAYTGNNVDSVVDDLCTIMGSVNGTLEGAFKCASGFAMETSAGLWFALAISLYLIWWLLLLWKAWKQTQGKKATYTVAECFQISMKPLGMFFLLFVVLQTLM